MATVEVMLKLAGAGDEGNGGGDSRSNEEKKTDEEDGKNQKGILRKLGTGIQKWTGIQFSVGAMLKQSQIFTSTVGVIFQLLGALVDVILAPFMPILIPAIMYIAKAIPIAQKVAQRIADSIMNIGGWFRSLFDDPVGTIVRSFEYLNEHTIGWITDAMSGFFSSKFGWFTMTYAKVAAYFPKIVPWTWKFIKGAMRGAGKMLMGMLKIFAPPVWAFFKIVGKVVGPIGRFIGRIFKFIGAKLNPKVWLQGLWDTLQKMVKSLYAKIGNMLKGSRMFGGIGKKMLMMAKATKAIPVLGAAATIGFGAYETYQATKKYGVGAGLAYGAKTLGATALTLGGASAAGLALDVGGSMALNKAYGGSFLTMEVKQDAGDGTTKSQEIRFVKERDITQGEGMGRVILD